ncbi:DUF7933 domain-containing protein [Winogradskyella pulchriflava]|uniref:Gliding motility-associated C-terminal domain-containing protein n=1 Tax=Winogradskyella pulchriflava TaxID=1110688 RepID=A0ABV6Q5G5_9FLAO
MIIKLLRFFFLCLLCVQVHSQTTDLSIAIEAQNLSGTAISQIDIYEDFQYLITISNSGNAVNDASISVDFDDDITIISSSSQNNVNGASDVSGINITNNVLTALIPDMPNNSSVELLVLVTAPTNLGGIAANGTITPPQGTTDTNTSNNQSIISIDVLDVIIDFSVTHTQIQPSPGTAINAWGDEVTYQFTITNNSAIDFPIDVIRGALSLATSIGNGQPFAEFVSLTCLSGTNGIPCPDLTNFTGNVTTVDPVLNSVFVYNAPLVMSSGGSISFEVVYRYNNFSCSLNPMPIDVNSLIQIELDHANISSNNSNNVITNLLNADTCPQTDICIETVQINPDITENLQYNQDITLETTVCNNGPSDAPMRFFLQNLTPAIPWNIISITCLGTTGPITCTDFVITENGQIWLSNDFVLPANTTITIETILQFEEPPCSPTPNLIQVVLRSGTNLLDSQLVDTNVENNIFNNSLFFPGLEPCNNDVSDIQVTKTQISPQLPIGSSTQNTSEWGDVIYEITVTNVGETDEPILVQDHMPVPGPNSVPILGTLTNVECIGTTGTASCFNIENAHVGVTFDGLTEDGSFDTFWEILPEDNWILPANSSVTFSVTVNWIPECSTNPMVGTNVVRVDYASIFDINTTNNVAIVNTYFAPCIDLVVQTYPESSQVDTGETFNWIVDVSNSTTSSDAINVLFEDTINPAFTITGTPFCTITSGNATCISNFNVVGNLISGTIPSMEAGSTVRITIPVTAPNFGGAFNNIAEAFPNAADNEELTPETNISINSVQVISPVLDKVFSPSTIFEGNESELVFTVYNIATSPTQNNISFTDNLPMGVFLSGVPNWVQANGCTTTFIGNVGDDFVGVTDLVFPEGVESCTFSVMVTSNAAGIYLNNFENFTNTNNIDVSQTSATLNVIVDTSNVDIEIIKTVTPTDVSIGEEVTFTITATNLGTTTATGVEISDYLPLGYQYISATPTSGVFDNNTLLWSISSLGINETATLSLVARVLSSNDLLNIAVLSNLNEIDRNPSNNEDDALVEVSDCLVIPEGISPNGDTINDTLVIPCIEDYPDNIIKIYNRYGTQIFESRNYLNTWNGKANMGVLKSSELLPVGTYFYVLEVKEIQKPFVGYVYLNY